MLPTIKEILTNFPKELDNLYGPEQRDVEDFLADALVKDRAFLLANPNETLSPLEYAKFLMTFDIRKNGYPPQYALGKVTFYNLPIRVTRSTLIPRPDTEILVTIAKEYIEKNPIKNVVDIGTGTGAVIIALAKTLANKDRFFIGTDKSVRAIARLNDLRHKTNVHFYIRDFFKKPYTFLPLTSWVLVSNPPYLNDEEMKEPSIQMEPKLALYGGKDGLDAYRTILQQVSKLESKPKAIFFEIGYKQAETVKDLANQYLKPKLIQVHKDLCDRDRVVQIEL